MADRTRGINKLSAKAVAAASEPGLFGDGGGLWLQVSRWGTKAWLFRFMLGGRARAMGLGSLNDFSLAEARERARACRQKVADGIDPIEARLAERDAQRKDDAENVTFKVAAEKFLAVHESQWRNQKHRAQWRSTLEVHAYPALGGRPVRAIDAALVNSTIAPIWKATPETASRLKQRIERICQWVTDGMPLPAPGAAKRAEHHAAMDWRDMPAFMAELRDRKSISARALEFTILTAARTGETIGARWDEIDSDGKVWTVPADRMKAAKPHRVPLSDRVVTILSDLPREEGSPFVFAGAKAGAPLSNMAMLQQLRGLRPGLTVHGFRSGFKDWSAESTSYPNVVSEAALAHTVPDKVEAAYRRGDLFAKRVRLMADWATYCEQAPATVTELRKAG